MRLENHDFEVLIPQVLSFLSKKNHINIHSMNYQFENNRVCLKAQGSYGGLAISVNLIFSCFVKGGALGVNFEQSDLDSVLMKGDILPYIKTLIKNNPFVCLDERTLYFYHPKLIVDTLIVNKSGIELTFK